MTKITKKTLEKDTLHLLLPTLCDFVFHDFIPTPGKDPYTPYGITLPLPSVSIQFNDTLATTVLMAARICRCFSFRTGLLLTSFYRVHYIYNDNGGGINTCTIHPKNSYGVV